MAPYTDVGQYCQYSTHLVYTFHLCFSTPDTLTNTDLNTWHTIILSSEFVPTKAHGQFQQVNTSTLHTDLQRKQKNLGTPLKSSVFLVDFGKQYNTKVSSLLVGGRN